MRLALYEPDIPQNAGTIMRLAACMGVPVEIIEPCGFTLSDRRFRRAGMDYLDHLDLTVHPAWDAFSAAPPRHDGRLILLTTRAGTAHTDHAFAPGDTLLLGRESAGVPGHVHATADACVKIPMLDVPGLRSLNVAVAAAMVLGEALRQTGGYPPLAPANASGPGLNSPAGMKTIEEVE
jgi:tRNA (cytidine/uridine-2'-O-)-methyltransferase